MRRSTALACVLTVTMLVGLAGCASEPTVEPSPSSFVGSSITQLEKELPADTAYVVYDVSLPVTGKQARYGEPGAGTNDDWLVVVACGSAESLAVGVVNGEDYTDKIAESARQGAFDDLLTECGADD